MAWETEIFEDRILELEKKNKELEQKNKELEYKIGEAYLNGYNEGKSEMKKGLLEFQKTLDGMKIV